MPCGFRDYRLDLDNDLLLILLLSEVINNSIGSDNDPTARYKQTSRAVPIIHQSLVHVGTKLVPRAESWPYR